MKLNSIDRNLFAATRENDTALKVNGADGKSSITLSRNEIVATGRLVVCEYFGEGLSKRPDAKEKYNSRLAGKDMDYATLSKLHSDKKFHFCAAQAYKAVGRDVPSLEEAKKDYTLAKNETFLRTMAAIDQDVLSPIFFSIFDDVSAGGLMQWEAVAMGRTAEITVRSNDVFLFEDSSWGSGRSTSKNYLYAKTITLNPKMYSCNATIKWYQDIVAGDAGRYYASIINGMWSKIYAMFISKLTAAASNADYIPAGLQATTYTTQNWLNITTKVAAANGVRREDLLAFGAPTALSNVLPVDGTGAAITGLQYGLGREWFMQGYLPKAGAVDLVEVNPVIVPGTQNSTLTTLGLDDVIFIAAKAGMGYAPIYGAYAEGNPITLTATASETADFTIDINVGAIMDIQPVFASKVGVITSVYPNA